MREKEKKRYGAIVAVGLRRIAGAGHSRRRRSENGGEVKTWMGETRGQRKCPFPPDGEILQSLSRCHESLTESVLSLVRWTHGELCFIKGLSPRVISCRSLVTITVQQPIKITRLWGSAIVGLERSENSSAHELSIIVFVDLSKHLTEGFPSCPYFSRNFRRHMISRIRVL